MPGQGEFHDDGWFDWVGVIAGGGPDDAKTEFPVERDHGGVAFPGVGDDSLESAIARVGHLPDFQ